MPSILHAGRFTLEMQDVVRHFECGGESYSVKMSEWIQGGDGLCAKSIEMGTEVWLFFSESDALVGFGSIGPARWRYPHDTSGYVNLRIIPALAVQSSFHGKPDNGRSCDKYSHQIVRFLVRQAYKAGAVAIGLFVHEDNKAAQSLYQSEGFGFLPSKKPEHFKMALNLSPQNA